VTAVRGASPSIAVASRATTPAATTDLAEGDPRRVEIEAVYRGAVLALHDAGATADPQLAALAAHLGEPLLGSWRERILALRIQGRRVRFPTPSRFDVSVEAVRLAADEAQVESCEVDDAVVFELASGAVVNDRVVVRRVTSVVARAGGSWRVVGRETTAEGEASAC
jgi:hypothetical protein